MPNAITSTGLTTQTQQELVTQYTAAYQTIYGADINLDQDSPDGQMMMIFLQTILDVLDLIVQVYNGMDPDNAIGNVLDQRVAYNGIQRQAGTYTTTFITLVTSQSLNLFGLDQDIEAIYTVSDNAGNEWQLLVTDLGLASGTHSLLFRAKNPGAVLTIPNTITIPVTIVLGVTSINNPTTYQTLGVNEESDAALRIRRQKSVSLSSQGYLAGLYAALANIPDVSFVNVVENNTGSTDIYGIPGHSIWVIVAGSGADASIAEAIYTKRNAGCGMKGDITYYITQIDGTLFPVRWSIVVQETLYIKFTATSLNGINPPNVAAIRTGLVSSFVPGVFGQVNVNDLATAVQAIDSNTLVTDAGFSLASTGPFTETLTPSDQDKQFAVTAPNIIIIPIVMSPDSASVDTLGTQQFIAYGGFGTYTWTMHVNNTGGSVSGTGLYTAGASPGTDTVRATDSQGNIVDTPVVVS